MATYKSKFITALNNQCEQIKKDKNWKYSQSTTGYTFESARKGSRKGNCAQFVCWALRTAGMIPAKGWIYLRDGGTIVYQGTSDQKKEMKEHIKKYFTIIHVNKPLGSAGLKRGDIIGFKGMSHTCVYDSYDKEKKKHLMWDGGSYANVNGIKLNCHLYKSTYNRNVAIILRPKTFYYAKPKIATESIVKALESIGVKSSFDYRKGIAQMNGIKDYKGTAEQNISLLNKLKAGKLIKG